MESRQFTIMRQAPSVYAAGFTIIELLTVIAIVSTVIAVTITSLSESRKVSRNQAVISQVHEYHSALELQYTDTGVYPSTDGYNNRSTLACIGDDLPISHKCISTSGSSFPAISIDSKSDSTAHAVESALSLYMSNLPHIEQPRGGYNLSSPAYSGCSDAVNPGDPNDPSTRSCRTSDYSLWFVLEDTNQDCGGRAVVANPSFVGQYTLCRLQNR